MMIEMPVVWQNVMIGGIRKTAVKQETAVVCNANPLIWLGKISN